MKRNQRILGFAAVLSISAAGSARATSTVVESWENTDDGWTVNQSAFAELGFSTTTGVTNGSYSWIIGPSATNTGQGPSYAAMLSSASTMAITTALGSANTLSIDVYTPSGSFGYYQQWQLDIKNTDIGGYVAATPGSYPESPSIGNESTLVFSIPSSITSVLATSSNPTSITFQIGGGYSANNETMYLDNVVAAYVAPPVTFSDVTANWVTNGSSNWENAANWSSNTSIPGAAGSFITFDNNGGAISGNLNVTLSQNAAATNITFGNTNGNPTPNYTINSGALGTSIAVSSEIDADSGTHVINVPVATSSGNFYFDILSGASLSIPNFSDTSYSNITKLDTGTLTLGASLHCSIFVDGTMTFSNGTSGGWLYGINVYGDGIVNLGANTFTNNTLSDADSSGNGLINIAAGGTLYTALFSDVPYSARLGGAGSIVVGGDVASAGSDTSTHTASFYGNDSTFSGTMTVSTNNAGPFALQVVTASALGDGSATNKLILDGGIFRALGYINGTQAVNLTANGGTIDNNTFNIVLGPVSSTAAGTLNKINTGMLTVKKMNGISLNVASGTVQVAPNGTSASNSTLGALTLAGGTSLDITNNAVSITKSGTPTATVVGYLKLSYDHGAWDMPGIMSSSVAGQPGTSIGYADGDTDTGTAAAAGTVLVMDTWLGDLNLDGSVTGADLNTITANIGLTGAGADWAHGDLNYDGKVNNDDVSLFMLGAADYRAGGSIPVPEPASLALLALGAGLLSQPRRRRQ